METRTTKACVAILILNKVDFKTKPITRDKEWPSNSTSGYLPEETQNINSKRICIHMFIAALFTIAKIWKQP